METHFRSVRGLAFGAEYLSTLNPDYVTTLVREYLNYAPTEPAGPVEPGIVPTRTVGPNPRREGLRGERGEIR